MLPGTYSAHFVQDVLFVGSQTFTNVDGNFSETLSISGLAAGDLLLIAVSFGNGADGSWSWDTSSGGVNFTNILDQGGVSNPGAVVAYDTYNGTDTRVATTGVSSSLWNIQSVVIVAFRGVSTLVNDNAASGSSGMPNGPAVSGAGKLHIVTGHSESTVDMTAPSGWTLAARQKFESGTDSNTAIAYNFDGLSNPAAFGGGGSNVWRATTTVWT